MKPVEANTIAMIRSAVHGSIRGHESAELWDVTSSNVVSNGNVVILECGHIPTVSCSGTLDLNQCTLIDYAIGSDANVKYTKVSRLSVEKSAKIYHSNIDTLVISKPFDPEQQKTIITLIDSSIGQILIDDEAEVKVFKDPISQCPTTLSALYPNYDGSSSTVALKIHELIINNKE